MPNTPEPRELAVVSQEQALEFCNNAFRNMDIAFSRDDLADITGALASFLKQRLSTRPSQHGGEG